MSQQRCRWGILGTAGIARKNWQAIKLSGNGSLVAVASRQVEKASQFIAECMSDVPFAEAPCPCTYEQLLSSPHIDAVYIPLPTGLRKEWVIRAAEAGKHVLVEKPVGVTAADVSEMLAACRKNNVQFMDGVMFMHSRRLERLRQVIDDGTSIGKLRRIATQFSFQAPDDFLAGQNIRVHEDLEPMGCLGDLGWYTVRFSLWVMRYALPRRVTGRLLNQVQKPGGKVAVPLEFSGELFFEGDVSASFYTSFLTENQEWASVSGSKGNLLVRDFVLPFFGSEASFDVTNAVFRASGCNFNMEGHTRRESVAEYSNSAANSQETNLFRTFGQLVLEGRRDDHWGEIALKTQQVLDACLRSAHNDGRPETIG